MFLLTLFAALRVGIAFHPPDMCSCASASLANIVTVLSLSPHLTIATTATASQKAKGGRIGCQFQLIRRKEQFKLPKKKDDFVVNYFEMFSSKTFSSKIRFRTIWRRSHRAPRVSGICKVLTPATIFFLEVSIKPSFVQCHWTVLTLNRLTWSLVYFSCLRHEYFHSCMGLPLIYKAC